MTATTRYPVKLAWTAGDTQETTDIVAQDFRSALVMAREGWGKSWTSVIVTDPSTEQEIDVAYHRSHGSLTPEEWVTRRLAPPVEVPIVSIDAFLAALQPQIVGFPGPTANRPVWVEIDGMLYAPRQIGLDGEFGGIIIQIADSPSASNIGIPPQD